MITTGSRGSGSLMRSNPKISRQEFFPIALLFFALCSICALTARAQPQDEQHIQTQQPTDGVQSPEHITLQFNGEPGLADDQPGSSNVPAAAPPQEAQEKKEEPKNTFQVYGFAQLDSGYDFKTNDPDWFDVVRPTKLPAFAGQFAPDGKAYF